MPVDGTDLIKTIWHQQDFVTVILSNYTTENELEKEEMPVSATE